MFGPPPEVLVLVGAKNAALMVYEGQVWRLLTPMVLHAGVVHLVMNLVVQFRVGIFLERSWGAGVWLAVFVLSGVWSAAASAVFLPNTIGVGASGSIMGFLGAWMVQLLVEWGRGDANEQHQRSVQFVMVFVNILIVLSFSAVPYIDWAAHAGGLVSGCTLGCIMFGRTLSSSFRRRVVVSIGALLWVTGLVAMLVVLFTVLNPMQGLKDVCALMIAADPTYVCSV